MKTRNIIEALAAIFMLAPMQSCLKDEKEVFEETSSSRLETFNNEVHKALCEGDGKWILEYYAGTNRKFGGYIYIMEFTESEVTVQSELTDKVETSLYRFSADNGPVLTFDTYNEVFHHFATPSSAKYEAYGGDFEFSIKEYSDSEIILRGKRTGNRYTLKKAPEGFKDKEYLAAINALKKSYKAPAFEGTINGLEVSGSVKVKTRAITFTYPSGEKDEKGEEIMVENTMQFTISPEGFHLYEPLEVNGYTFTDFSYNVENNTITDGSLSFQGFLPEGYHKYEEIPGDYKITWDGGNANVTVKADENEDGFIMTGLVKGKELVVGYDESFGGMTLCIQNLGTDGDLTIKFCPLDYSSGGYLTQMEDVGVDIKYDLKSGSYKFYDNGVWENFKVDSFIIYSFTAEGDYNETYRGYGNAYFFYLKSMTKL